MTERYRPCASCKFAGISLILLLTLPSAFAQSEQDGGTVSPASGQRKSIFSQSVLNALKKYPKVDINSAERPSPSLSPQHDSSASTTTLKASASQYVQNPDEELYEGAVQLHNLNGKNEESEGDCLLVLSSDKAGAGHATLLKVINIKPASNRLMANAEKLVPSAMRGSTAAHQRSRPRLRSSAGLGSGGVGSTGPGFSDSQMDFGGGGPLIGGSGMRYGFGEGDGLGPGGPAGPAGPPPRKGIAGTPKATAASGELAVNGRLSSASDGVYGRLTPAGHPGSAASLPMLIRELVLIAPGKKLLQDKHEQFNANAAIDEQTTALLVDSAGSGSGYQKCNLRFTTVGPGMILFQGAVNNCSATNQVTRQFTIVGYVRKK